MVVPIERDDRRNDSIHSETIFFWELLNDYLSVPTGPQIPIGAPDHKGCQSKSRTVRSQELANWLSDVRSFVNDSFMTSPLGGGF
jgi:hypothetical protein